MTDLTKAHETLKGVMQSMIADEAERRVIDCPSCNGQMTAAIIDGKHFRGHCESCNFAPTILGE